MTQLKSSYISVSVVSRSLIVAFLALNAVACATSKDTRCGVSEGQPCANALEILNATDGTDWRHRSPSSDAASAGPIAHATLPGGPLMQVTEEGGRPILHQPVPLRVWIAPYEDASHRMRWAQHVYTVIAPARYAVGAEAVRRAKIYSPLTVGRE